MQLYPSTLHSEGNPSMSGTPRNSKTSGGGTPTENGREQLSGRKETTPGPLGKYEKRVQNGGRTARAGP